MDRGHRGQNVAPMEEEPPAGTPAKRSSRWRLVALGVFFFGSLIIAHATGITDRIDVETIRAFMDSAGALGFVAFLFVFAIGELLHIPGLVFVGAASVAYGDAIGTLAAYAGALGSLTLSFYVVRLIGGQPLAEVERPIVKRILARLDEQPLRTVTVLRFVFWMSPALNYALAMSTVRYREYLLGSMLGLLIPIPIAVVFFDSLASGWLGEWLAAIL